MALKRRVRQRCSFAAAANWHSGYFAYASQGALRIVPLSPRASSTTYWLELSPRVDSKKIEWRFFSILYGFCVSLQRFITNYESNVTIVWRMSGMGFQTISDSWCGSFLQPLTDRNLNGTFAIRAEKDMVIWVLKCYMLLVYFSLLF